MRLAYAFALAAALSTTGCMIGPKTGDTIAGPTIGRAFTFTGYFSAPNTFIDVQVLRDANLDPKVDANWDILVTAKTEATPNDFHDPQKLYKWTVNGIPVPSAGQAARWPQGGLLRFRAIARDGQKSQLAIYDEDFSACYQQHQNESWQAIGKACRQPYWAGENGDLGLADVATVASITPNVIDGPNKPPYLSRKGNITPNDTAQYYAAIGAPPTLAAFKQKYGFDAPTGDEVGAIFYNEGDLGIGREMHCKSFRDGVEPTLGRVCYVNNYGVDAAHKPVFGGDVTSAVNDAAFRRNKFATVAMVKNSPFGSLRGINFIVYDANGNLSNIAQLDSTGQNVSIPNNCLNCHGGTYNTQTKIVTDAHFLPFDPDAFKFASFQGYSFNDQQEYFRRLNEHVYNAGPTPAIQEIIDGWYGGAGRVSTPGAKMNAEFIPSSWTSNPNADKRRLETQVYSKVYKRFCRTCHLTNRLDLNTAAGFFAQSALIVADACSAKTMPHAEHVMKNFWTSSARGHLVNAMGVPTACNTVVP